MPFEEMRRAVVHLDADVLSHDAVTALQKCVPLPEELELVMGADTAQLGYAERFVLHVGSIPRLKERLDCFSFKHRFNGALHSLYGEVQLMTSAADQLVECTALRSLLGVLLRLGNALNQGSFRSGAEGFRTECLTRLAEVKTNGEQSNLLQYALAVAAGKEATDETTNFTPLESFTTACSSVRPAAKLSSTELIDEVGRLKKGLEAVKDELSILAKAQPSEKSQSAVGAEDTSDAAAAERFLLVMRPFFDGAMPQIEELNRATVSMGESQTRLKTYFAEESKTSIDECLSRWATFLAQVDSAVANYNEDGRRKMGRADSRPAA